MSRMTTIKLAHGHFDSAHLTDVTEQMRTLGSPVIRAVETSYGWAAIEGCHRIRAAAALGVPVRIVPVEYSDDVAPGTDPCDGITIAAMVDDVRDESALIDVAVA
jgi:hypothetical protein